MNIQDIPYFLYQLSAGQDSLELNLLITIFFRAFYYITIRGVYKPKRRKISTKRPDENYYWGFILKETILIGLGIVNTYFTIAIGLYSSLTIGNYLYYLFKRLKGEDRFKRAPIFISSLIFNLLFPIAIAIYFILDFFVIELVVLLLTANIFLMMSLKVGNRDFETFKKIMKQYNFRKSPTFVKLFLIFGIIIIPTFAISISYSTEIEIYMVEMHDGVKLQTRVYRPVFWSAPKPIILMRTPYNQDGLDRSARNWLERGFIVVTQDFRGQYYSEGEFRAFMSCASDGYDTCEWIVNQPWCNGKIGSTGCSAGAINQYYTAGQNSPGLFCQQLDMGAPEAYEDLFFTGGKWKKMSEVWINLTAGNSLKMQKKPLSKADNMIYEFIDHWDKNDYWNNGSLNMNNKYDNISCRALHYGGWFDIFTQGTINGYMGYSNNGSNYAKGHQKLVIGPFTHGSRNGQCGDLFFPNAGYGNQIAEKWRDEMFWESLQPNNLIRYNTLWEEPNVLYYVMGDVNDKTHTANTWRYAEDWPVVEEKTAWYLHKDGSLSNGLGVNPENISYIYDPENPVLTWGGNNLVLPAGTYDQRPVINDRDDVISFSSEILAEPLEIIGNVNVKLWISSNCTDTDFTAKLVDVYPNGYNALVCDGIISGRKRNGFDKNELLTPGEKYEININLWSTAYQFNTGHKLRLLISSSNSPKYQVCPNTGVDLDVEYSSSFDANNTIHLEGVYDSSILLPINEI
ncbi:MAG: CocE/NonD family hydrolase [Candidatus Lokiarchaeota archaeon]|nr:CocE/NonD family hydrolase [Candidatus Lokiarchaeota archaeon]